MINSVARACRIMDLFSEATPRLGLSEISEQTGIHKSTLHHILATLVQAGWLDQDEQRRYGLGVRLLILGTRVMNRLRIGDVADRHLQDLQQRVRETIHLAMVVGAEAVYLKKVEAEHSIRVGSRVGMHVPLHASAVGKVLLAYNPSLWTTLRGAPFIKRTPRTITDPKRLTEHLERVRAHGYATDCEEFDDGLMCIAAPVYDHEGRVIAAVSASGPVNRMRKLTEDRIHKEVALCARAISRELGLL